MKKLGIAIKNTIQGSGEPFKINAGPWANKVTDIRDILRHVPSLESDPRRSIIFFSFSDAGCYIVVARSHQNRGGDNIAGWIFVPYDIQISGQELVQVVEQVRQIIFSTELPPMATLEQMFSKAYPLKAGASPYSPSPKNNRFGKRDITPATPLPLILGTGLYQSYYKDLEAIFVETMPGEVVDAVDLTARPLEELITVYPPAAGNNITFSFVSNGEAFNKPMKLNKGGRIELRAMRRGFEPVTVAAVAEADGQPLRVGAINWQKKIGVHEFNVYSPMGDRMAPGSYQIAVNGQPLAGQPKFMSESELGNARITILMKNGERTTVDTSLVNTPVDIRLKGNGGAATAGSGASDGIIWNVTLKDETRGQIMIKGRNVKGRVSPLKGYEADGNWLEYKGANAWAQRAIGFGAALLLGIIVVGILAICGTFTPKHTAKDKTKEQTEQEELAAGYEMQGAPKTLAEAIEYLKKPKWNKSEMEEYPDLAGLFDALNKFDFDAITLRYKEKLKDSPEFLKLVGHVEYNINRGWQEAAKNKTTGGTFLEPGDEVITVSAYQNWVNGQCGKSEKPDANAAGSAAESKPHSSQSSKPSTPPSTPSKPSTPPSTPSKPSTPPSTPSKPSTPPPPSSGSQNMTL